MCTAAGAKPSAVPIKISAPLGFVAGAMGALCGVGGGVLILPALRYATRMTQHQISGTSLLAVTLASVVGAGSYLQQGTADIPVAVCLASTAMASAGLGVCVGTMLSSAQLTRIVGCALLVATPLVAFKSQLREFKPSSDEKTETTPTGHSWDDSDLSWTKLTNCAIANSNFLIAGCFTGFASGLLGLGGGIVMTTYMALGTDMSQHQVVATSLVAMVPTGIAASAFHLRQGSVQVRTAGALAASCAIGMGLTSTFITKQMDEENLRYIFGALLGICSTNMILS